MQGVRGLHDSDEPMSNSLIPERPLLISPTVAATIGLEEAVLLHVISELLLQHPPVYRQERRWAELDDGVLLRALPFWDLPQCMRVLHSLQQLGLVLCEPVSGNPHTRMLAINQPERAAGHAETSPAPTAQRRPQEAPRRRPAAATSSGVASLIPPDWQPDDVLLQLCRQRNIPEDFIQQEVPAFVLYWRERGKVQYSWQQTFLNWIVPRWEKQRAAEGERDQACPMPRDWQPSPDATSILEHAGVSLAFIEDAVPEFVLYWREKGVSSSEWNSKFIAHVRRQWLRYTHSLQHDATPRPIPADFRPDPACFEVLGMANIDADFAWAQLPEFILYWQDRNEAHASWNTKFLQHVKFRWAQQMQPGQHVLDKLTDRSWAD